MERQPAHLQQRRTPRRDHRLPGLQPPRLSTFGAIGQRSSSIVRKGADGSEDRYAHDATRRLYLSTSGTGAYDTIRYRGCYDKSE